MALDASPSDQLHLTALTSVILALLRPPQERACTAARMAAVSCLVSALITAACRVCSAEYIAECNAACGMGLAIVSPVCSLLGSASEACSLSVLSPGKSDVVAPLLVVDFTPVPVCEQGSAPQPTASVRGTTMRQPKGRFQQLLRCKAPSWQHRNNATGFDGIFEVPEQAASHCRSQNMTLAQRQAQKINFDFCTGRQAVHLVHQGCVLRTNPPDGSPFHRLLFCTLSHAK